MGVIALRRSPHPQCHSGAGRNPALMFSLCSVPLATTRRSPPIPALSAVIPGLDPGTQPGAPPGGRVEPGHDGGEIMPCPRRTTAVICAKTRPTHDAVPAPGRHRGWGESTVGESGESDPHFTVPAGTICQNDVPNPPAPPIAYTKYQPTYPRRFQRVYIPPQLIAGRKSRRTTAGQPGRAGGSSSR